MIYKQMLEALVKSGTYDKFKNSGKSKKGENENKDNPKKDL